MHPAPSIPPGEQPPKKKAKLNKPRESDPFRWASCTEDSDRKRLEIKEAAVKVATEYGGKIAAQIQGLVDASESSTGSAEDTAYEELKDWMSKYRKTPFLTPVHLPF